MQVVKLDHVNIRTAHLDVMIDWYTEMLGLRIGYRPPFPFDGAWLYAGDTAIIHLVAIEGMPAIGSEVSLKLEHFALKATGMAEFESKLKVTEEKFIRSELPDLDLVLYNIWDPDGNHIHVDFKIADESPQAK